MSMGFGHPHPRQIENMIGWLTKCRDDIDSEIRRLKRHQEYNRADLDKRDKFQSLMRDLVAEKCSPTEAEKRLSGLGYPSATIKEAQHLLKRLAASKRRNMRDAEIVRRYLVNSEEITALAAEYGISRVQAHRIIKKAPVL